MRAVVGADGRLIEVTVENSSGVRELDQAARRIVEMAQPFQAFTSAMKAEADRVSMVCTFRFTSATNGVSSLP
jgi:protein TonB